MAVRKLKALGYPHADGFDAMNDGQLRNLVVWLEDTKICRYKIEERGSLRQADGPKWEAAFRTYLEVLECPRDAELGLRDARCELLDWLVGHAVALDYHDNAALYGAGGEPERGGSAAPLAGGTEAAFDLSRGELEELAGLLKLPLHDDDLVLLRAICNHLISRFTPAAIAAAVAAKDEDQRVVPLDYTPLGFATGDTALDRACKVSGQQRHFL